MMYGYVIQNIQESCLAKQLFWYKHDNLEDAYVHPADEIENIKKRLSEVKSQMLPGQIWFPPKTMIAATWSDEEGVKITGKPEQFPWDN